MKKWYVVHTYSGQEGKVKQHLEALVDKNNLKESFGQILLPTREVTTVQKGKKTTRDKKFYPSYLLVEMEMNKDTMHYVTDIPGVTHFVGVGKPQPLRKSEVDRILGQTTRRDAGDRRGGDSRSRAAKRSASRTGLSRISTAWSKRSTRKRAS